MGYNLSFFLFPWQEQGGRTWIISRTTSIYQILIRYWTISQAFCELPCGSVGKNLPVNADTRVRSLGREDPLEEDMATHFSVLAWEVPWTEEPGGLPSMGSQELDMTEWLNSKRCVWHWSTAAMKKTDELMGEVWQLFTLLLPGAHGAYSRTLCTLTWTPALRPCSEVTPSGPRTYCVVPPVHRKQPAAGHRHHRGDGQVGERVGRHVRHWGVWWKLQHHDHILLHLIFKHEWTLWKETLLNRKGGEQRKQKE